MAEAPPLVAPAIAESAAEQRIARNRFDVPALVARADHRFLAGDHRAAAAFYAFALKCPGAASADAAHAERMKRWLAERFREHLMAGIEAAGLPIAEWPPRFRKALQILLGERTRDPVSEQFPQLPNYFFYPDLPYVDFVDPGIFPWRTDLERRFDELRDEAAMLLADTADFSPYVSRKTDRPQGDVHGMLENSDWSSLYLWRDGAPVDEHVERCPKTFEALVEHVPLCRIG
ncbi:MAG: aspartyl/asparaginyl beta-hydroxylase domain-containing protein, partial [Sphingomonas sp.]